MTALTNRFFNDGFNAPFGSLAKSVPLDMQFQLLQAAFTQVASELDALTRLTSILQLNGFPASFSGAGLKILRVNAAESSVEFVSPGGLNIKSISAASYTLLAADAGSLLIFTSATAITVTVNSGVLPQGTVVCVRQGAAGQVTLAAGSGVTFQSSDNLLATRVQGAQIAIISDNGSTQYGVIGERNATITGIALLASANVFTNQQAVTPYRANIIGAVSIDLSAAGKSNNLHLTLTGNVTSFALTNPVDGAVYNIRLYHGASAYTFAGLSSAFKFAGGTAPTWSTTASAVDFLSAQYGSTENTYMASALTGMA